MTEAHPEGTPTLLNLPPLLSRRFGAIQIHPALRDLLPVPTDEEAQLLEASLKEEGLRDPIVIGVLNGGQDQVLLDGHTRMDLCGKLGLDLEEQRLDIHKVPLKDLTEGKLWVLKNQTGRRNLSPSQRAILAAQLADLGRGNPQICGIEGTSQAEAAEAFDTSPRTVQHASKVLADGVPELVAAVVNDEVRASTASELTELPAEEQRALLAEGPEAIREAAKDIRKRRTKAAKRRARITTVQLEGTVEIAIDIEIDVNVSPEKAIRTTVERLSDLGKACRLLRGHINPTILVDAISRAVQTEKITISRALDDTDEELVSSDVEATALPVTAFSVVTGTGDIVSDSSDLASNDVAQCVDEPLPEDTP